jgi:heavy metal sensor kinase
MSIRLRLTLWYTLILSALLGVIGFAVFNVFAAALQDSADRKLDETVQQVLSVVSVTRLGEVRIPVEANVFRSAGLYLQVIDPAGLIVRASSSSLLNLLLNPSALDLKEVNEMQPVRHDVYTDGSHLRVLTVPLGAAGQLIGYLQAGLSVDSNDQALAQLTRLLIQGWLAGVVLGGLGGAFLARQALRPIGTITNTAIAITNADDLSRRIPVPRTRDEVGKLADTFNHMLERLEKLFRSQQRFTADISHELRTPLTTIRGNVDLMRRMRAADDASLDAIQSETERMTRMVGDLLLLAQADAGLPIRREPVSLDTLMLEVYRQLRIIAKEVNLSIGDEDVISVMGDPDRLKQLLINLTDNAIRYTPPGGSVVMGLKRVDGHAQFSVSDTGPGIPAEHLAHVFVRFYLADKARSRHASGESGAVSGGAGLGLSIARWIVDSHGGRIEVKSEVGQGTTFLVSLPELKA